ncbi:MAG TPA: hypothetical protein VKI44_29720 [Acetobacteraceae bacterium]|nr:hypothetical protein [Acetobacteraceae bacterium]
MNRARKAAAKPKPRRRSPKAIATTVNGTRDMTGLGRTKIYELIAERKLKTVAVGRRRLVLIESIEALLRPSDAKRGAA